ncbi:MAG TPA: helix-turn-helix domain-containing protein [Candidatus Thermoplasmatota archaeon]|nr:helix-turn-helix domain-containing protein [Candidatus Thermoplasmatota archaeon]
MSAATTPPPEALLVPASILGASGELMAAYDDIVRRCEAFSVKVGDLVRVNPAGVSELVDALVEPTKVLLRRWNLPIIYMLSLTYEMRFSQIQDFVHGISNRSLSLKLDEMEKAGLLVRKVSNDKPPHVSYSLTERGHTLSRLSFPWVLHLSMTVLEAPLRRAAVDAPRPAQ